MSKRKSSSARLHKHEIIMAIELKVPEIGESIIEVEIGGWLKKPGEVVRKDEPVVTLESEKATVELPSPGAGTIGKVLKQKGDTAKVGEVIAYLEEGKVEAAEKKPEPKAPESKPEPQSPPPKAESEEEPLAPRPTQVRPAQERTRSERLREEARAERETARSEPQKSAPLQRASQETGAAR